MERVLGSRRPNHPATAGCATGALHRGDRPLHPAGVLVGSARRGQVRGPRERREGQVRGLVHGVPEGRSERCHVRKCNVRLGEGREARRVLHGEGGGPARDDLERLLEQQRGVHGPSDAGPAPGGGRQQLHACRVLAPRARCGQVRRHRPRRRGQLRELAGELAAKVCHRYGRRKQHFGSCKGPAGQRVLQGQGGCLPRRVLGRLLGLR
mmetsp:Transcript_91549/g.254955  ORF Transcript_91549/g.254955 Transcript_91549/m.254955 type:complete len:209 (+) Transcript_91549:143-769(+)